MPGRVRAVVNAELARAIKTESATALRYWFGVSAFVAWRWRQTLGVSGTATTPGSRREHLAASQAGAEANKTREWTDEELDARAETSRRLDLARHFRGRWTPETGAWTTKQLALLGTVDDAQVARKLGRTANAVRVKRLRLKIPAFRERRKN